MDRSRRAKPIDPGQRFIKKVSSLDTPLGERQYIIYETDKQTNRQYSIVHLTYLSIERRSCSQGGWELFQQLLLALADIGSKHGSYSVSSVALAWVLAQPAVGGAIVGTRLGYSEHIKENSHVFDLRLDEEDMARIYDITRKSQDLMNVFGDCGGEYRSRR